MTENAESICSRRAAFNAFSRNDFRPGSHIARTLRFAREDTASERNSLCSPRTETFRGQKLSESLVTAHLKVSNPFYIKSLVGEGWTCLPHRYHDGGFTGGNMERRALKRLMADIGSSGFQASDLPVA